jgi:hypothetical protein
VEEISGGHPRYKWKRFQEVTTEIRWKRFPEVTTEISGRESLALRSL